MNSPTSFYIDKASNTFADNLLVFGFQRLLSELCKIQGIQGNVACHDNGAYYSVALATPIVQSTLEKLREQPAVPGTAVFILTSKNKDNFPRDYPHIVDYEAAKEEVSLYFASRSKAQNEQNAPSPPHPHWEIYRAINLGALQGYNKLIANWWAVRGGQPEICALLFELFSQTPNRVDAAIDAWKQLDKAYEWGISPYVTCLQLYNPSQGKGQNHVKADQVKIDNLKNGFWLLEWLKLVGFYEAALTRQIRGAKDRKTFVIAPRDLSFAENRDIMGRFADTMRFAEMPTRLDLLVAIHYLQEALTYFNEPQRRHRLLSAGNIKRKLVGGFSMAYYKDLGNTTATMNIAFIALPGWVEVHSPDDIPMYRDLLDELERLVRQFDESHSDAFTLLQYLRDFVSGDDLDAFFRFTNAFPAYLMHNSGRGRTVRSFSTKFVERLIMAVDNSEKRHFADIIANPGFQNIAYAIRQSTRKALHWTEIEKQRGRRYPYDIRYGLGQELVRAAPFPSKFLSKLSDFLLEYNNETMQVEDLMRKRGLPFPFPHQRRSIDQNDITQIVQLIDQFGSEPVAKLLIAYGYATDRPSNDDSADTNDNTNKENIE